MNNVLVIVDMQPSFEAANCTKTIGNIVRLSEEAISHGKPIVLVEYDYYDYTPTQREILDCVSGGNVKIVKKKSDSGCYHVAAAIQDMFGYGGIPDENELEIDICGVNLGACVRDTAIDLKRIGFKVKLYKEACNQPKWWGNFEDNIKTLAVNGITII